MSRQGPSRDGLRPPGVDDTQGPENPANQGPPRGQGLAAVPPGQGGVGGLVAQGPDGRGQGPHGRGREHGQGPQGQGPQGQGQPGQGLGEVIARAVRAQQWEVADQPGGPAPFANAQAQPQAQREDLRGFAEALERRMAEQFATLAEQLTTRFEALETFAATRHIPLPMPVAASSSSSQPPPMPTNSRSTPMKVKEYHGETDYGIYAVQFGNCARHNGWDEVRQKDELINALQGKALTLLQCMPNLRTAHVTFQEVDDALRRTFAHKVTVWERLQQFQKLRQSDNQSLQEFAREVESKATLAYPDMQSSDLTPLKIQAFINGLQNEKTKAALAFQTYPNLMAALDSAIQGNTILGEPPVKKARLTTLVEKEGDEGIDTQATQCLQALVTALQSGKTEQSETAKVQMYFPDKGGSPSKPGGPGATGGETTGENRGRGRGRGRPRGSRGGRGRGGGAGGAGGATFCTFCNKRGHTIDDCWTLAAQKQQQQQQHHQQQPPQQIPLYPPQYYHAGMSWQNQVAPVPHQYYGYLPPLQSTGTKQVPAQQAPQAPVQTQQGSQGNQGNQE